MKNLFLLLLLLPVPAFSQFDVSTAKEEDGTIRFEPQWSKSGDLFSALTLVPTLVGNESVLEIIPGVSQRSPADLSLRLQDARGASQQIHVPVWVTLSCDGGRPSAIQQIRIENFSGKKLSDIFGDYQGSGGRFGFLVANSSKMKMANKAGVVLTAHTLGMNYDRSVIMKRSNSLKACSLSMAARKTTVGVQKSESEPGYISSYQSSEHEGDVPVDENMAIGAQ